MRNYEGPNMKITQHYWLSILCRFMGWHPGFGEARYTHLQGWSSCVQVGLGNDIQASCKERGQSEPRELAKDRSYCRPIGTLYTQCKLDIISVLLSWCLYTREFCSVFSYNQRAVVSISIEFHIGVRCTSVPPVLRYLRLFLKLIFTNWKYKNQEEVAIERYYMAFVSELLHLKNQPVGHYGFVDT